MLRVACRARNGSHAGAAMSRCVCMRRCRKALRPLNISISSGNIDCEPQRGGHLYIAHRQRMLEKIAAESKVQNEVFGYKTRVLSTEEVRRDYVKDEEARWRCA